MAGLDSAWMRFFPGLNLSPCCLSPLFTKPLWTFSFSDYEVWVTVPPPAWSRQIRDRLRGVAPYRYPPATSSRFSPAPGAGGACSFLCSAVRERFVCGLVVFVVVVLMVVVGVVLVVVVLVGVGVVCRLYLIPLSCRMQQQRCPIQ